MTLKLRLAALGDMAKRYGAIAAAAWRARRSLDSPKRTRAEIEFLPGALAVRKPRRIPRPGLLRGYSPPPSWWVCYGSALAISTS